MTAGPQQSAFLAEISWPSQNHSAAAAANLRARVRLPEGRRLQGRHLPEERPRSSSWVVLSALLSACALTLPWPFTYGGTSNLLGRRKHAFDALRGRPASRCSSDCRGPRGRTVRRRESGGAVGSDGRLPVAGVCRRGGGDGRDGHPSSTRRRPRRYVAQQRGACCWPCASRSTRRGGTRHSMHAWRRQRGPVCVWCRAPL